MPTIVITHNPEDEYDIFIGRGSVWANPYGVSTGTQEERLNAHRRRLLCMPRAKLLELRGKRLFCDCGGTPCFAMEIPEAVKAVSAHIIDPSGGDHTPMIEPGQVGVLRQLFTRHVTGDRVARLWIMNEYGVLHLGWPIARRISSFNELTMNDWRTFRDQVWPAWSNGDWTRLDGQFKSDINELQRRYAEEMLGQRRTL